MRAVRLLPCGSLRLSAVAEPDLASRFRHTAAGIGPLCLRGTGESDPGSWVGRFGVGFGTLCLRDDAERLGVL